MEIAPPQIFSFDATKWLAWKQRFENFRVASDLCNKASERQIAMLVYAMIEKAKYIYASFKLSADDSKECDIFASTQKYIMDIGQSSGGGF